MTSNNFSNSWTSIAQTSDGRVWVAWYSWRNTTLPDVWNYDIWYITSDDGGATWSEETQFTRYLGYDYYPDIATVDSDESLGLVWQSDRAGNDDIWFGIVGALEDVAPPPIVQSVIQEPGANPEEGEVVTVAAQIVAEAGVDSVELVWSIDSIPQTNIVMFDDGTHGDETHGDSVYTAQVGPFAVVGTVVEYQILATDLDGNDVLWRSIPFSFRVLELFPVKSDTLLVVDSTHSGDVNFIAPFYKEVLNELGVAFDFWDTSERGAVDLDILNSYLGGVVIWSKPYWSGVLNDSEAQQNLGGYLDAGGKLFVTGQDVAERIDGTDFLTDYLHTSFVQNDTELYALDGVEGDPISNGLHLEISGVDGARNQFSTDEINVFFPGVPVLYYDESATVPLAQPQRLERASSRPQGPSSNDGLASELDQSPTGVISSGIGGLRADTGTYKVVFFSFGFEGINSLANRAQTMKRVLTWLDPSLTFCTLDIDLSYAEGTLSMDFEIGTSQPANWDLWLVIPGVGVIPVWSILLPAIDPNITAPLSFPFPNMEDVGFLTTLTTPEKRIICYDFEVVNTGTPSSSATPSADELRRLLPKPVGALSNN